jgi:CRP-like cAMP-binding protein
MVSPELLRRYTFFGGLSMEHIVILANLAHELTIEEGTYFFHEDDDMDFAYLLVEGDAAIVIELLEKQSEITINDVKPGEVLGWSGILPPHKATASAKAQTACTVVAFDCQAIRQQFDDDVAFAYVLTLRVAQVLRDRLHELRIESLAFSAET